MKLWTGDCVAILERETIPPIHLTFLDPPFNQAKAYAHHQDNMPEDAYWRWMVHISTLLYRQSVEGTALYFMQREKNTEFVLRCLRDSGWILQNLVIWKKLTSAVPSTLRFGKQYQVIAYATKGDRPRVFNRLRIDPPLPANYKHARERGMFVTDVWDDIRELTAGYFAGDEALRLSNGERAHKQQAPLALLVRIILSSSQAGDVVCDPFSGTGTTLVAAHQLKRQGLGIEIDSANAVLIQDRLAKLTDSDLIYERFYTDYRYTDNLDTIWGMSGTSTAEGQQDHVYNLPLF
ncbi:MAG: site-specific DNA-methyltransferase [Chloroflexota bacterium]|nr:site-specific DNA-methyltransferase [Chloroflexota bacterium]